VIKRRAVKGFFAALLVFVAFAVSCGGDSKDPTPSPSGSPSPSPTRSAIPTLSPSPTPAPVSGLPARDLVDLARRFRGLRADAPRLARDAPYGYAVGDTEEFAVLDLAGPSIVTISATVRHISDHAYFFVAGGSGGSLERIAADFESVVYPTVTASFGQEWSPGVDSDPRISIVHADLNGAGGYFSGSDEHTIAMVPRSNEREALYLDREVLGAPGAVYNTLVAHELQHLVHWNADSSEDSWVNEGLSEVAAEEVSGVGALGGVGPFLANPDTQLTFWPSVGDAGVHYAAAALFFSYLLDHYGGRERARELLTIEEDSILGIERYLGSFQKNFRDVFADWVVANYADAPQGPYAHPGSDSRTHVFTTVSSPGAGEGSVGQFAADYIQVNAAAGSTFVFDGADEASIGVPGGDGRFWWSDRGDGADTRMTQTFDLSGLSTATLRFNTWYEIEEGWDYAYVAASTDGGATWTALPGRHSTDYNPVGAAYGPGYTGSSGGWVAEEIDLTAYAGQEVTLRFENVTDDATSFTGFAVDDIEIPELGYHADGPTPSTGGGATSEGWTLEGFRLNAGPLPQQFIVQKIEGPRDNPTVTHIPLDAQNRAEIPLAGPAVIAVSGATDGTAEKAAYAWELRAP
jgi:hypothetical protein